MQKRLLIAGGSHADIPVIAAAKKMGYQVFTTGNRPEDRGHAVSDGYFPADYSSPDEIAALAESLNVNAVCASANDFSAISASYTAEQLSLPGHDPVETAKIIHHKDRFRAFAHKHGIRVPKAISLSKKTLLTAKHDVLDLEFPLIVKPVDLSGGKGMSKVESVTMLSEAIHRAMAASRAGRVVVEEYIEGTNHGYSAFLKKGKVVFAFMDDEQYFLNPFLVSGASTSLHYTRQIAKILNGELEKIASRLSLVDGLLHVQFILKDQDPFILEICRRTPGDLYVKLIEYATGFNMAKAIVCTAVGKSIDTFTIKNLSYVIRHCVMVDKKGRIAHVRYDSSLKSKIIDQLIMYHPGEEVDDFMTYKAEIVFFMFQNKKELSRCLGEIVNYINIEWME